MSELESERIYTIPLRKVKAGSVNKAANRAVREVRSFLERHMKTEDVWIDDAVNQRIWARGMYKIPSKLRVRAVKFDDGVVEVSLPDEEAHESIRDTLAREREGKERILTGLPEGGAEGLEALGDDTEEGAIEAEPETGTIDAEPEAGTIDAVPEEAASEDAKADEAADSDDADAPAEDDAGTADDDKAADDPQDAGGSKSEA